MSTDAPLELTDPTEAPTYGDGILSRWCKRSLHDPRDEVFVRLTLQRVAVMSTAMVALWFSLRGTRLDWVFGGAYLALWGWLAPPVILMLHCTMHRPFLRRHGPAGWLDRAHPYVMSFYFGIPTGYAEHHVGMHHVDDNLGDDLSKTVAYRRDSFLHFLVYVGRFLFLIYFELPFYMARKRRGSMGRQALTSEIALLSFMVAMLFVRFRFGLVAFAIPYFASRSMMMVGNWGQHAFINTARENDGISNAITCVNSPYNRRCFNDGYHIGHHLKPNRHWTELPADFQANREKYHREGAIVFQGLDFFIVSVLLWTGQWRVLARRFVRLDGQPRSDEDVIALLKSRVVPIREEEWAASLQLEPVAGAATARLS
jgi:fatty acid desaturase